jgi:hypothetical protein
MSSQALESTIVDRWVRHEGEWYREPRPFSLSDKIKDRRGQWAPQGASPATDPKEVMSEIDQ